MSTILSTDEIDLYVDPLTNDFPAFGNITTTSGLTAVVQSARIALALTAGEWFLDLDRGIARFERDGIDKSRVMFGAKFDRARALREYRGALLGSGGRSGVVGLTSLIQLDASFDSHTRTQFVKWQAITVFGNTELDTLRIGS
jgi:hypothetical protein